MSPHLADALDGFYAPEAEEIRAELAWLRHDTAEYRLCVDRIRANYPALLPEIHELEENGRLHRVRSQRQSADVSPVSQVGDQRDREVREREDQSFRERRTDILGQMADLFQGDKSVILRHIKNVFDEGELHRAPVVAESATTAADGKTYLVEYAAAEIITARADAKKPNMGLTVVDRRRPTEAGRAQGLH